MRIMHISSNIFPSLNTNTNTKDIWKELARNVEEYHVVVRSDTQHFTKEKEENIILHRLPKLFKSSASFLLESGSVIYLAKKYKIDIILAQSALLGGVVAIICKKLFGMKVMIEVHGEYYFNWLKVLKGPKVILNLLIRWVYKNADVVRVLNEKMLEKFEKAQVKGNFKIIYNRVNMGIFSIPKSNFSFSNNKVKIVSVGTFLELKGYHFALEALGKYGYSDKVEVTLIGGGEQADKYKKIALKYGIELHLYDRMPQKEFVKFLYDADIYIQPSFTEAVPRAIIEAMAMRLPILASDVGMVSGLIINNRNGLIFSKGEAKEFITKLSLLINDEQLRKKLASNAYEDALKKYEWNRCFEHYREVLYSLK